MSEKYEVSLSFEDLDTARKVAELLSLTFPMLTFELTVLPDIKFDTSNLSSN